MCTICIESPSRQFDALARLHQQSMLIFATVALSYSKSALESFQWLRGFSWCVLSNDSFSPVYWNLHWIVLKSYILPQRHKRLISEYPKNQIIFVAEGSARRPSMIANLRYTPHLVSILQILRIWILFTRSIRLS